MKKVVLIALCLLFIGSMAFAQRPKTETFNGTISGIPGMQTSAPITFTVDNSTGACSFVSKGNGEAVEAFSWQGQIPAAKNYSLGQAGAVWSGQLTDWSDMTFASGISKGVMKAVVGGSNSAPISGMANYDGKSVRLTIRVPYQLPGQEVANIPFICTLDLTLGQTSNANPGINNANPGTNNTTVGTNDAFGDGFESLDNLSEEEYNEYIRSLNERLKNSDPDHK